MKYIIDIATITKEYRGIVLTKKQMNKIESHWRDLIPVFFKGRKVLVKNFDTDISRDKMYVNLELIEI